MQYQSPCMAVNDGHLTQIKINREATYKLRIAKTAYVSNEEDLKRMKSKRILESESERDS